jgi:hypothetical protein
MADADLDVLIRKLAKQQQKSLTAVVKRRKAYYASLAGKAKDAQSKQRYRQLAKDVTEIGTATVKRLQMSADNAAYSYARSVRQAIEISAAAKTPVKKADAPPAGKKAKKSAVKKTAKRA